MTKQQARRLLLVALALSVLIHLALAISFHWPFAQPQENVSVERIEHIRVMRVAKAVTPPPPPPSPIPSPKSAKPHIGKPSSHIAENGNGIGGGGSSATATPLPSPVASATPNCGTDIPAALAATPDPPMDIAAAARADAKNADVQIRVEVDAKGLVTNATVAASSGSSSLDLVVLGVAKSATYTPALHQCKPVPGEVLFVAKLSPIDGR